ncbi:gliding motility-associated C-terminal domain-containing protein [Fluviicola taffensis]|uniref:PKD domain containing protein n=1 Tax=Fluviicola taffensis (strain DSM 16823 / NCIMB 13979 / RW262) TaxID=755732 RepID=F2IJK1_FLUTR|nr:gliding motility-associated C-terminal domain-containing protein [Fluviicola taffensis]AEA42889.1 PKD domain containing protein [Fluviicola taffensis DSM 16823]
MKKLLFLSPFIILPHFKLSAQCDINASATSTTITCGQSVNLSAFGSSTGQMVLNETFNTGGFGAGWGATPGSTNFSNPCSPAGVNGTPHAWMDDNTSVPRTLTSAPYNLTAATAGVSICFDLLFAEQGDASPCEGPDEPDEGVFLQYSTNGGATWIDIHYFDPNGGNDPQLTNWNNWCFELPPGAITGNTLIRWHQTADSGADYDHWGIDNVQIFQNDINAEVEWLHDGYSYGIGNPGGVNPNAVTPTTTTTYTAQITTGTGQVCTTTITINVIPPIYDVNVSANPTTVCTGDCSTISGTGQIILDPGGIETYENNETGLITGTPGIPGLPPFIPATPGSIDASMNINITGLNNPTVQAGQIQSICINSLSVTPGFGCTGTSLANVRVVLECPGGTEITLVNTGQLSGTTITDMCFSSGGATIGSGSSPYTGSFAPFQAINGLNGCTSNGVWTMKIIGQNAQTCIPLGGIGGWNITFDDPPVYQPVTASWSPTTGLSSTNTVNTTACPTNTTNYVLTLSNGTPGCPTHTENVNIIVDPCGGCIPPVVNVNSLNTCAPGTVNLTAAIAAGSAPATLTYHATQTDAQNDISPISTIVGTSGTYWVRYEDPNDPTCFGTAQIVVTINPAENPAFTLTNFCPGGTNQATGIATPGGTFSFNPAPIDGATINASTGSISNATTGTTYTVQYTTSGACPGSTTHTVTATSFSYTATITDETCGNTNGEINITPNGGSPLFTYSLNGGTTQASGSFTGLSAGAYSVLIVDNAGCQSTGTENVGSIGGPTIDNLSTVNPTCGGGCNGSITATVSGGNPPYTYAWFDASNNPVGTNSATISNLCGGTYSLEVTDANGTSNQLFFEDFESGAATWTLNVPTGTEGADPNFFVASDDEGGVAPGGCGVAGNGDATLHITSVFFPAGGAAYDAGGGCGFLFCPETNRQAESPVINTVGQSNLTLKFNFIAQGDIPNDQATVWYNAGAGWVQLGGALFSGTGACAPQGIWTAYSNPLPAACENIANLRVAIRWQNNDDGNGTDPSVAINNLEVITASAASCPAIDFATLTAPGGGGDPSFAVTNFCEGSANSATGVVTAGGTFAFNPIPTDGATINAATGAITNGVGGTTYTVQYTTPGACSSSQTNTVTVNNLPIPVISGNLTYCAGGQTTLSAGGPYASYSWSTGPITQTINTTAQNGITVTVIDNNGCQGTSPSVNVTAVAQIVTNSNVAICQGQTTTIHGNQQTTAGVYTQTFPSTGGCDSISNVTLVVNPSPNPVITGNLWYCEGSQVTLDAGGPYASYSWSTGGNQQTIQTTTNAAITVTVTDANGCSGTSSPVSLVAPPIAIIDANPSTGTAPLVVTLTNGSQNANAYYWNFGNGSDLNTANTNSQTQTYDSIGQYTVMLVATSQNGCSDTAYVTIVVIEPAQPMIIEFPNIFTPNGDKNNDFFEFKSSNVATLEVIVTNRWGNLMFKSTDIHFKWDGTLPGGDASEGVYFYQYKVTGVLGEKLEGQKFVHLIK